MDFSIDTLDMLSMTALVLHDNTVFQKGTAILHMRILDVWLNFNVKFAILQLYSCNLELIFHIKVVFCGYRFFKLVVAEEKC